MNLGEISVICLGQDKAIPEQYIFTNNMCTCTGKFCIVPKDERYGIVILTFQYQRFYFWHSLKFPDIQKVHEYCSLYPNYVDTDT